MSAGHSDNCLLLAKHHRCAAGPAPEGPIEGALGGIAEHIGNLYQRHVLTSQQLHYQVLAIVIQQLVEGHARIAEAALIRNRPARYESSSVRGAFARASARVTWAFQAWCMTPLFGFPTAAAPGIGKGIEEGRVMLSTKTAESGVGLFGGCL